MGDVGTNDWCILRTASRQTLPLTKALSDEGFCTWTPTEIQQRRARRDYPRETVTVALMPSIVFADYARLTDLIRLARAGMQYQVWDAALRRMVVRGMPHFRVLRDADHYARVRDVELAGLRRAEKLRLTMVKAATIKAGDNVRVLGGAAEGLRGTVESVKGMFATVQFGAAAVPFIVAFGLLEMAES